MNRRNFFSRAAAFLCAPFVAKAVVEPPVTKGLIQWDPVLMVNNPKSTTLVDVADNRNQLGLNLFRLIDALGPNQSMPVWAHCRAFAMVPHHGHVLIRMTCEPPAFWHTTGGIELSNPDLAALKAGINGETFHYRMLKETVRMNAIVKHSPLLEGCDCDRCKYIRQVEHDTIYGGPLDLV